LVDVLGKEATTSTARQHYPTESRWTMNYDPKIGVVGSGSNYYKGGYVRLSQINRLEIPKWIGRIENGWQQKLVQMEKDYYWRLDIRIPPLLPTPLDTWHTPPEDPSGFDPNYHVIILTLTEARQWLIREGYDIHDDLAKLINAQPPKASGGKAVDTKQKKTRKKTPPQLLKETRERHAAQELTKNPNITAEKLGKKLECDKSTIVRLKAWQNRGILAYSPPPNGFKKQDDEGRTDTEAIGENESNNEIGNL
jgi:hypothetical protein